MEVRLWWSNQLHYFSPNGETKFHLNPLAKEVATHVINILEPKELQSHHWTELGT
jgi:hypothetical protein